MKATAIILLLLSTTAIAEEGIRHETQVQADGAEVHKYELRQTSDRDTVAVIRITHSIQGQLYEATEYLFSTPGDPVIGILAVPDDRERPEIDSPIGKIRPIYDKSYMGLTTGSTTLKAALGAARVAEFVRMRSTNEVIEICLYRAPMKSAQRRVPQLPNVDEVSAFLNYENQLVRNCPLAITEDRDGRVTIQVVRDESK